MLFTEQVLANQIATQQAALLANTAYWVTVPGGPYNMGADVLLGSNPTHPATTVTTFRMGKNPVTNDQWRLWVSSLRDNQFFLLRVSGEKGPTILAQGSSKDEVGSFALDAGNLALGAGLTVAGLGRLARNFRIVEILHTRFDELQQRHPVVDVSWCSAVVFALAHGCSLPSMDQFGYAATEGGHKERMYATKSGKLRKSEAHYKAESTCDVDIAKYPDGPFGLRHLCGNVEEWLADEYKERVHPVHATCVSMLSELNEDDRRLCTGGSWRDNDKRILQALFRYIVTDPLAQLDSVGFRLVVPAQDVSE